MPCESPGPLSLRVDVLSSLACSRLAKEGLTRALEILLHTQAWDFGVAWLGEDDYLRYAADCLSPHIEADAHRFQAFVESVRSRVRPNRFPQASLKGGGLCSCHSAACMAGCCWGGEPAEVGMQTALALPLARGGVVYGVIELFSRTPRDLDETSRQGLQEIANDLGKFLWSRRLETRARLRSVRWEGARRTARLAYWECSISTGRLRAAMNMSEVLGVNPANLPTTLDEYLLLAPEEDRSALVAGLADLTNPSIGSIELEHRIVPHEEGERVVVVQGMADFDADGNVLNVSGTVQDITPYRRLEDRLRLAVTAIDHAGDAIVIFDARGAIMSVNSAFTRITGYSEPEAQGQQLDELLNRPSGKHDESFFRRLLGRLRTYGRWKGELWARAKNGRGFAMLLSLSEIRDDKGRVSHHVGVFTDVSRQKEYKERLEVLALHDSLTGLPNRALFLDRGQQALSRATRNSLQIGVIFIDLDLFKRINDTWGHAVGDEVLRRAGERMRDAMRDCDTVARLGGDEFVVLLTDVKGVVSCIVAAERLLEVITEPYAVNGISVALGASLGIALSPQHGDEIRCLLHRADQALYSIKRNDVRRIAVWSPSIQEERAPVAEGLPCSNRSALRS